MRITAVQRLLRKYNIMIAYSTEEDDNDFGIENNSFTRMVSVHSINEVSSRYSSNYGPWIKLSRRSSNFTDRPVAPSLLPPK